jgi:uncharacterized membrane-anchored protein
MRTRWVWAALGLQLLVLLAMAVPREWALRFGPVIFLRTAPVDPRDVMRGDYVQLSYEISNVPRELCRDGLARAMQAGENDSAPAGQSRRARWSGGSLLPPDTLLYAVLKPTVGADGVMELDYLTDVKPRSGLYIRGRLEVLNAGVARVRYGLEAYFMQQGDALELERSQAGASSRASLEMQVALGRGGLAVLKGHRRGPLEIGLDLIRRPAERVPGAAQPGNEIVVSATVRLRNASDTNLAIIALPEGRSFALVPDFGWGANPWRWRGTNQPLPACDATHVILLEPGAVHRTQLDLTREAWWVVPAGDATAAARPLTELTNVGWPRPRFRFEYRPPPPEALQGLPHAAAIWRGRLLSPAFTPFGNVD